MQCPVAEPIAHLDLFVSVGGVDSLIAGRGGKATCGNQREETSLQLAAQMRRGCRSVRPPLIIWVSRTPRFQHPPQHQCSASSSPGQAPFDCRNVEHSQNGSSLHGPSQRSLADDSSEIDDRAGWARAGNALTGSRLLTAGRRYMVTADSLDPAPGIPARDHVDHDRCAVKQTE